jgi:predicted Rossmann fold flavoprotein
LNSKIQQVEHSGEFLVRTSIRDSVAEFRAPALVVATGGLSIPKMGASSFGYEMARQFGLAIRETRPALVPLILPPDERSRFCDLAGVSTEVIASFGEHRFHEKMLITHRGLSGPAILQISSYWKKPEPILLDLAPGRSVTTAFHDPKMARNSTAIKTLMHSILPHRLSERWVDSYPPKAWTTAALDEWEDRLHRWPILPSGTEGYEKAEVTAGGVDPDELSAKSMESRKVPGLFFIGEVVDVTGQLGGFNFQWAWSSGAAAGRAL